MTDSIEIPIGPGATLDGGPFADAVVYATEFTKEGASLRLDPNHDPQHRFSCTLNAAIRQLTNELNRNEPIRVSGADPENPGTALLELPLTDGYIVDVHGHETVVWEDDGFESLDGRTIPSAVVKVHTKAHGADYYPD